MAELAQTQGDDAGRWWMEKDVKPAGLSRIADGGEWVLMGRKAVPLSDVRGERQGQFLYGPHLPNGRRFILTK